MLRVGTPVYDREHRKRGIVLVNYFGQVLIERIRELLRGAGGQPLFLNKDGFWLLASSPAQEWGFMFGNGNTLAKASPKTWSALVQTEKGQLWTDAGLYTFDTIYPLLLGQVSSTGAAQAYHPSAHALDAKSYFWKVLTRVDGEAFQDSQIRSYIPWHHALRGGSSWFSASQLVPGTGPRD